MPKYTYQDSEARKPYEEPGDHHCFVESFEWKIATSGNDMLSLRLRTDGGALVYDNLVFTENAYWKIDHALKCFLPSKGKKPPAKGADLDMNNDWVEENLLGAHGWITLSKRETPQGKMRNEVQAYLPFDPKRQGKSAPPAQGTTTKPAPTAAPTSASVKAAPPPAAAFDDDDSIPF